jgi:hypothetical protein
MLDVLGSRAITGLSVDIADGIDNPNVTCMTPRIATLAIPFILLLAQTAGATPQFSQVGSLQLFSVNAYDSPMAFRSANCSPTWWDPPPLSLAFLPLTWAFQDYNRPELDNWSFAAGQSDCTAQIDVPSVSDESDSTDISANLGEVDVERTPMTGNEAARVLKRAWTNAQKEAPSVDALLILVAHWAHETRGGISMFNYNFGGIKGRGPDGLSCLRTAHEGSGFRVRIRVDRFRAYVNAKQGAEDYLSLLMRKYPGAIAAAERGDMTDFVSALKRGRYFTGSEQEYARSLSELAIRALESGLPLGSNATASGKQIWFAAVTEK